MNVMLLHLIVLMKVVKVLIYMVIIVVVMMRWDTVLTATFAHTTIRSFLIVCVVWLPENMVFSFEPLFRILSTRIHFIACAISVGFYNKELESSAIPMTFWLCEVFWAILFLYSPIMASLTMAE